MVVSKFYANRQSLLAIISVMMLGSASAAEWKAEPSLSMRAEYNDNVRMLTDENSVSTTGYTIQPRVELSIEEQRLWDLSLDMRGKLTRYQDIENSDSDNMFFSLNGVRRTELTEWNLGASYERNSNFDTDYDTETSSAGLLLDDRTEQISSSISPSFSWYTSETSIISAGLTLTDVSFDKVTNENYKDYEFNAATVKGLWRLTEQHQLGFTTSYSEYDSDTANFTYDMTVLQLDYTYRINEIMDTSVSIGGRRLDSLATDVTVACQYALGAFSPTNGQCPDTVNVPPFGNFTVTPVQQDIESSNDGVVATLEFNRNEENAKHILLFSRAIIPSSFASALEDKSVNYHYLLRDTERLTYSLVMNATKSETISGQVTYSDRIRYRFEPSIDYRLSKNWNISLMYRYLKQSLEINDVDSVSNAIFINLYLYWPKLATTY